MKKRIWELDAFRGLCVLGMVVVHLMYDLVYQYGILSWQYPLWFWLIQQWGGILFILLSGICVTLGRRHIRRGLMVLGCAMVISAVTLGLYLLGLADVGVIIYFGVLHCLGACMLLWAAFRHCPDWLLTVLGVAMAAAGLYLQNVCLVSFPWLVPLGFTFPGFNTSDYFPLLPNLGYFLLGAVAGRRLYGKKESLLPGVNDRNPFLRFLSFCGRQSLWIYMGHQPILGAVCMLISYLK